MFRLSIKKSARKEMDLLPHEIFVKVDGAIPSPMKDPFPYPQSKRLKGEDNRRLRIGEHRVVYTSG